MHIAVDLDDVMLDFMAGVISSFELEFGEKVKWDGQPFGTDAEAFCTHPAFRASGYKNWWGWLRDRDWLWSTFGTVQGSIGGVKQLREAGHYMECVTSKPEWAEYNVWKWLGKWRPPFNQVTIVTNGQSKLDYSDAELIIDDKHETCVEWATAYRYAIEFKRFGEPVLGPRLLCARTWPDVINLVKIIDEEEERVA